jgi:hypothetical protein
MKTLPRRGLISAGLVLVILTGVNLWMRPDFELQLSPTSFGVGPAGLRPRLILLQNWACR